MPTVKAAVRPLDGSPETGRWCCARPPRTWPGGARPAFPPTWPPHDFLALPRWHHATDVLAGADGQHYRFTARTRVIGNNQFSVRQQLAVKGLGLSFHVEPEITARMRQPAKVRLALHALRADLDRLGRRGRKPRRRARGRG